MKGDIVLTRDVEVVEMKDLGSGSGGEGQGTTWNISAKQPPPSKEPADWMDGFRRAERRSLKSRDGGGYQPTDGPVYPGDRHYDLKAANAKTANTALARELKGRHLQMIAFGGAIGELRVSDVSRRWSASSDVACFWSRCLQMCSGGCNELDANECA